MTTALYLLRAVQSGLRIGELELLTFGDVMDILTEQSNDSAEQTTSNSPKVRRATQDDFDRF